MVTAPSPTLEPMCLPGKERGPVCIGQRWHPEAWPQDNGGQEEIDTEDAGNQKFQLGYCSEFGEVSVLVTIALSVCCIKLIVVLSQVIVGYQQMWTLRNKSWAV